MSNSIQKNQTCHIVKVIQGKFVRVELIQANLSISESYMSKLIKNKKKLSITLGWAVFYTEDMKSGIHIRNLCIGNIYTFFFLFWTVTFLIGGPQKSIKLGIRIKLFVSFAYFSKFMRIYYMKSHALEYIISKRILNGLGHEFNATSAEN